MLKNTFHKKFFAVILAGVTLSAVTPATADDGYNDVRASYQTQKNTISSEQAKQIATTTEKNQRWSCDRH